MLCETYERNEARLLDDHEAYSGKRPTGPPDVMMTGESVYFPPSVLYHSAS
jgi:hypothetical protein